MVISENDQSELIKLNSVVTLIDQIANCISAIPTLILWDISSIKVVTYFVVGYNLVGCVTEIWIMGKLLEIVPELNTSSSV